MQLVFHCSNFAHGPSTMANDSAHSLSSRRGSGSSRHGGNVVEIQMCSLGSAKNLPFLFARCKNGALWVYQAYRYLDAGSTTHDVLELQFCRHHTTSAFHALFHTTKTAKGDAGAENMDLYHPSAGSVAANTLIPFSGIAGYDGVFVRGPKPVWIFSIRDTLAMHQMTISGHVVRSQFGRCHPLGFSSTQ